MTRLTDFSTVDGPSTVRGVAAVASVWGRICRYLKLHEAVCCHCLSKIGTGPTRGVSSAQSRTGYLQAHLVIYLFLPIASKYLDVRVLNGPGMEVIWACFWKKENLTLQLSFNNPECGLVLRFDFLYETKAPLFGCAAHGERAQIVGITSLFHIWWRLELHRVSAPNPIVDWFSLSKMSVLNMLWSVRFGMIQHWPYKDVKSIIKFRHLP